MDSTQVNPIKPGGWNKNGLQFNDDTNELRFFVLGSQGAEELPLDAATSEVPLISTKVNKTRIQLLESRDVSSPPKNLAVGIRATESFVQSTCRQWNISADFLDKVRRPGALAWFSSQVEEARYDTTGPPKMKALEVCFRWGEGHNVFVVIFCRYDLQNLTFKGFLSSRTVMGDVSVLELLNRHAHPLFEQPLRFLGFLMGLCESFVDTDAQEQNKKNLEIGGILGIQDLKWLKSWHIEPIDSLDKSKAIYAAYDSTNWLNKSCEELISIGKQYLALVECAKSRYNVTIPRQEVQDAVHRAELHTYMLQYLERMLRSQFDSYNNLLAREESKRSEMIAEASHEDSLSMKTISYLTMIFFPITFVSAIFSTTIFDFQQWDTLAASSGVVSPGWWVFVLSCGLVTFLTLGVWRLWQAWVRRREELKLSRGSDGGKGPYDV